MGKGVYFIVVKIRVSWNVGNVPSKWKGFFSMHTYDIVICSRNCLENGKKIAKRLYMFPQFSQSFAWKLLVREPSLEQKKSAMFNRSMKLRKETQDILESQGAQFLPANLWPPQDHTKNTKRINGLGFNLAGRVAINLYRYDEILQTMGLDWFSSTEPARHPIKAWKKKQKFAVIITAVFRAAERTSLEFGKPRQEKKRKQNSETAPDEFANREVKTKFAAALRCFNVKIPWEPTAQTVGWEPLGCTVFHRLERWRWL